MIAESKKALLSGFLGQLSGRISARLAKAVEVDRLSGGDELPHELILNALRPQLRNSDEDLPRTPTPQRLFCRPFEDLLVDPVRTVKQKGRIARSTIEPVWKWLETVLIAGDMKRLGGEIREAITTNRLNDARSLTTQLWAAAAPAMQSALKDEKSRTAAAKHLGGMAAAEDAAEIALLISVGEEICAVQDKLPRPMPTLDEEHIPVLREAYDKFSVTQPDAAAYIALIVMGRLERPWEALRLAAVVSRQSTDTLISATDLGIVGELLFADLEDHVKAIAAVRPGEFDAERIVEKLGVFAALSSGMVKELAMRRDGKWGQRLTKARGAVSVAVEKLLERAVKDIPGAFAPVKMGGFGRGPRPLDLSRSPDEEKVGRARRYAYLMAHTRHLATAAAFHAKLSEATGEVANAIRTYAEDLLREYRAVAPESQAAADRYREVMLELATLILGEEEAGLLRRRSRVSAAA